MSASSPRRRAAADGGDERALGALGVAHLDELPEPASRAAPAPGTRPGSGSSGKRGGPPAESGGDVGEAVVQRRRPIGGVEPRGEVHEAGQRRQAAEPAAAAARDAEVEPGAEDVDAARIGFEQRDRRLRQHERDVALEPVAQPLALVRDRVVARAEVDEHVVAVELDREAAQLVGELVERAAGRQVEARVVPVAGEDAVADACRDGAGSPCAGSGCRPRAPRRRRRTGRARGRRGGRRAGRPPRSSAERRGADGVSLHMPTTAHRRRQPRTSSNVEVKCATS